MTATVTKPDLQEVLDAYLQAWNTDDPEERATLLDRSVTDDVEFIDPLANIKGRADLAQHIVATRATYPDLTFVPRGDHDEHNNLVRAPWVARLDGRVVLRGLDIDEISEDGRLSRVIGFFDRDAE